jgi:hypothetical protein
MKKTVYTLGVALALATATSCNTDFLEKQPLDQFSETAVWNDPALVETFVNNIYYGVPHGFFGIMLSSATDESMAVWDFESSNVTKSQITPSYLGLWDENFWTGGRFKGMSWANAYKNIRAANLFFEKIADVPFDNEEDRKNLMGQVHFLRAFMYHNLAHLYGGVPIITEAYGLKDEFDVPRESYENVIKFIVEDLDKAAELLPLVQGGADRGRATKGAALALKSRTLLYSASDLYHNQAAWAGGYSHPELIGYVNADRTARWQAARDAAKAVIDLGVYSLYNGNPDPVENYREIFLKKETSEDIYVQFFIQRSDQGWDNYHPGLYNGPNGFHNWGGNTPLGQLVDEYEMANGNEFSWNNPEHKANPYQNRDPRFYASILYEGAQWRQRPADVKEKDPQGIIQAGYIQNTDGTVVVNGLDTRKSPIEDWNGSYTGYYLRKFMDPTVDAQYFRQEAPWRYIRYAEILLNYAEALMNLGQEEEAKQYLNMVRERAGMPDITATGQELVEEYRNERQVELAYEDHRYFDVRRWMVAPNTFGNAQGVKITYKPAGGATATTSYQDVASTTKPTYEVITVQDRAWDPRAYFLPIKLDEMNRNDQLIQNPLY